MARFLWLSVAVLVLDQATKWWAQAALAPYERLAVWPFFNLTLVYNPGAAFSFLSNAGGWQRWFFVVLAGVITVVLVVWLLRLGRRERLVAAGLALVIGGALGNLIDRLWLGHVVDFLDFHWAGYHWPAFNIADSAITLGVACLLWDGFFGQGRHSEDRSARL
jgi:signal peptidase II